MQVPDMTPTHELVKAGNLAAELMRGTCTWQIDEAVTQACMTVMGLSEKDAASYCDNDTILSTIDDLVFQCGQCNWWCETSEASENEDMVCIDCANED